MQGGASLENRTDLALYLALANKFNFINILALYEEQCTSNNILTILDYFKTQLNKGDYFFLYIGLNFSLNFRYYIYITKLGFIFYLKLEYISFLFRVLFFNLGHGTVSQCILGTEFCLKTYGIIFIFNIDKIMYSSSFLNILRYVESELFIVIDCCYSGIFY